MNIIIKSLNQVNNYSKKLIIIACTIVLTCCIGGISLIMYNATFENNVELYTIGTLLIQRSTTVFAQFTIGALVMDYVKKIIDSSDDQ